MNKLRLFFVISISCQLSGAVLLLLKYCFVNIDKGIEDNKMKENHAEEETFVPGNTQPTPSEFVENVWINRIAFALIAIGYLTSVWGGIDNSLRTIAFIWIIILSAGITIVAYWFSKKLGSNKKS